MKKYFITGISTDVGKTVIAAIITEALEADYWKPVQAGDLEHSDADRVKSMISNSKTVIHPNSYALKTPMSPHAAAEIDGISIDIKKIQAPVTNNHLVVEGAGGLLVPLNDTHTILDLIDESYHVIVVSRHYLGSINHTLLTLEALQRKGITTSIIFSGEEHPTTESIIVKKSGVQVLGRVDEEPYFDQNVIAAYASELKDKL